MQNNNFCVIMAGGIGAQVLADEPDIPPQTIH